VPLRTAHKRRKHQIWHNSMKSVSPDILVITTRCSNGDVAHWKETTSLGLLQLDIDGSVTDRVKNQTWRDTIHEQFASIAWKGTSPQNYTPSQYALRHCGLVQFNSHRVVRDRLCGLVVRVIGIQIRRPGFDSRHWQKTKVLGLERGPLSLVSTTEELLDRKVAAPV
jgi:hypothetical protein